MDQKDYDQIELTKENLGDNIKFLKEETNYDVFFYEGNPISIDMPTSVELKITYTEKGIKGDTSGRALKPATLDTGLEVMVPLFCDTGDMVRVDTRSGEYIERVRQ